MSGAAADLSKLISPCDIPVGLPEYCALPASALTVRRRFRIVLIKPSRYDDDGYVVQWWRSAIPSNSLAVLYSLCDDAARRGVLGPDIDIEIDAIDESNSRVRPDSIIAEFRRNGGFGMVGLVGVQSNQFPRALDIARPLRAAGVPVVIGGFHVSGCLSMLPEAQADLKVALDMGCALFAGELEGRIDSLLADAAAGEMRPLYNFLSDLPGIGAMPPPVLPARYVRRTAGHHTSFDAGRGCPYQCSFCTIINVQGRKSRRRTPDDVEELIRLNWAQGIHHFFITDDNFARNKDWEAILDRIILLRERDGLKLKIIIQVDTLCHKLPNFVEKSARAGVTRVFIGLENINPDNLAAAKKRQNKITEYRRMLLDWKKAKVITYAGYILGFPADTPQSIREDIAIIKRELPVDILEFFCLTPLPGSEDHKLLDAKGVAMDPDMNKYDLEHVVTGHAKMSRQEWEDIYHAAWSAYYTRNHMRTIMRRAAKFGVGLTRLQAALFFFAICVAVEKVHPLQGGIIRLKSRVDRRPGLPIEPFVPFWLRRLRDLIVTPCQFARQYLELEWTRRAIRRDSDHRNYMDAAVTPPTAEEEDDLDLFTHTESARHAVAHARKVARLTDSETAAA